MQFNYISKQQRGRGIIAELNINYLLTGFWPLLQMKTDKQEVPFESEEELSDQTQEQIAQRGWGVALTRDTQEPSGCSSVLCAVR